MRVSLLIERKPLVLFQSLSHLLKDIKMELKNSFCNLTPLNEFTEGLTRTNKFDCFVLCLQSCTAQLTQNLCQGYYAFD